jgi:serine/threonine-protein kinase
MEPSKRIGDYEVLAEIGRGGMGKVFRVRNVLSDRIDAMKVLLPDLVESQELAARFLREIKVLAALNHPHIAALRTALTADNQLVMIMEYVEGQSLAQRLRHGAIPTPQAIAYIDQVLDALDYAHKQHVVHRDIKPANMMVTPAGVVKLMDFGIARAKGDQTLTAVDTTTGSLGYMSPEQVHGKPTDGRSDLYSVGISLYEMVTGERPFKSNSDFAVMLAQVNEQPRPPIELLPALSPDLNAIILKAIAKDPAARFQSADEFRQALHALPGIGSVAASSTETITWPPAVPVGAAVGAAMAGPIMSNDGIGSNQTSPMLDAKTLSGPPPVAARAADAPTADPWARSGLGHPVMFVILGGVLVIGALVGTGLYLGQAEAGPGRIRGVETSPVPATTAPLPAPEPAATPNPPVPLSSATDATPAPATPATAPNPTAAAPPAPPPPPPPPPPVSTDRPVTVQTPPADARPRALAAGSAAPSRATAAGSASSAGTGKTAAPKQPARDEARPPNGAAVVDQLEREVDLLTVRVDAVNNGLDHLQQEQARQGLGLRGDMAARQSSMNLNLSRAQQAISARDAARAQRYRDAVEADVEALEKFLGR